MTESNMDEPLFQAPTPMPSRMPTLAPIPPPISFEQQDLPMNFEEMARSGHDMFGGPGPPVSRNRNDSTATSTSHNSADTSLETHRMLSNVLYDLRLEYGKQWSTPDSESPRRDGIFRSVSLLCDIVQEALTDPQGLAKTPANIESETNITFMLTLTAISMILNIYRSICEMYSPYHGNPAMADIGKDGSESMLDSFSLPPSNASASLDKIVHLTTMDFHLARLQRMFSIPNTPSNFQTALVGSGEGVEQISELRIIIQRLVERVKTA